jgi:hypothetical protein
MWVEDTYRESEFVGDDPNWLRQVGIICDEDRHLELLREGIPKKSKRRMWAVSTAHFSFGMLFVGMA